MKRVIIGASHPMMSPANNGVSYNNVINDLELEKIEISKTLIKQLL
jgi:hypothetical protein